MKTYRIGIIGFGLIGKVHAYGYANLKYYYDLPFDAELFGVCARSKETLEKARKYGFKFYTRNFAELINHPETDIIDICSPNIFHKEQILTALRAQKPLYCEKPLVCDIDEAREVEKELKGYQRTGRMAFHNRFFPAALKTKSLLEENFLGELINFRFTYYHSGSLEKEKPMSWKLEKGSGVLLDLGSHLIDLAWWYLGEFESVTGTSKILYPFRFDREGREVPAETEDCVAFLCRMKNGATGTIEASKVAAGSEDELIFEIYGSQAAVKYNSMSPNFLQVFDQRTKEKGFCSLPTVQRYKEGVFPGPKFGIGWTRAHVHSIYSFLRCVHEEKPDEPSLQAGVYNMKVADAVLRSIKTNDWEKVI